MAQEHLKLDADILSAATVVGKKEHEGPLSAHFDAYDDTNSDRFGQDTWEKAEAEMSISTLSKRFLRIKYA